MRRLSLLCALLFTAGCSSPTPTGNDVARTPAGIVLSLSTDLTIPTELDGMMIQVDVGTSTVFTQMYSLPSDATLPGTLVLQAPQAGDVSPGTLPPGIIPVTQAGTAFTLTVKGQSKGKDVVVKLAKLTMPPSVKKLEMAIESACASVTCAGGQSCSMGTCKDAGVDTTTLPDN